jgi:hypothetical protein
LRPAASRAPAACFLGLGTFVGIVAQTEMTDRARGRSLWPKETDDDAIV